MKVSTHAISTSAISAFILLITSWPNALLFLVGGVLIDFDHYLRYVWLKKDLNLKNAYKWNYDLLLIIPDNPKKYIALHIFHTIESLLFLLIIGYFWNNYFLFFGVCFHIILDEISMVYNRTFGVRKLSILHYLLLNPSQKKNKIIV